MNHLGIIGWWTAILVVCSACGNGLAARDSAAPEPTRQVSMDMNDDDVGVDELQPGDPGWTDYFQAFETHTRAALGAPPVALDAARTPPDLLTASLQAAAGDEAPALMGRMNSSAYLAALDPEIAEYGSYVEMRLAAVIPALAAHHPDLQDSLLALADDDSFAADAFRQQLLIHAAARINSAGALRLWQRYTHPDNPLIYDVVGAIIASGNPQALTSLHAMLADSAYDAEARRAWLTELLVWHRYSGAVIDFASQAIVDRSIDVDIRRALAEAMFHPDPSSWDPAGAKRIAPEFPEGAALGRLKGLAQQADGLGGLSGAAQSVVDELVR